MEAVSPNKFIEILKNGSFSDDSKYGISLGSYSLDSVFSSTLLSRGKHIGDVSVIWNKKNEFHLSWKTKLYEDKPDNKYLDLLAALISKKTGWRRIEH
jgi:hypothetical protein